MSATRKQVSDFGDYFLDTIVDWISDHLYPEDVFREKELAAWAEAHGYRKDEA